MNLLSIEYFVTIAEYKSFTRASDHLFVSQQALSEHIKKLEEELGCPLFKRGRSLILTPAGEIFLEGSKKMLEARDQMLFDISQLTQVSSDQITIAVATFDTPPFLSDLLFDFQTAYPQYRFSIVKRLVWDISTHMEDINIYISYLPLNNDLENYILKEDELCVAINKNLIEKTYGEEWPAVESALLEDKQLSHLSALPFVLLYDKHGYLSQDLDIVFSYYNLDPIAGFKSENADLNFSMCLNGLGAFIGAMDMVKRKLRDSSRDLRDSIVLYPIDSGPMRVALAFAYPKGHTLTLIEKRFIETARHTLARTEEYL